MQSYLTFVKRFSKIFSVVHLNSRRIFVKIVDSQNIMATINDMTNRFDRGANVGNLVLVLLIVVTVIIKPAGACMV